MQQPDVQRQLSIQLNHLYQMISDGHRPKMNILTSSMIPRQWNRNFSGKIEPMAAIADFLKKAGFSVGQMKAGPEMWESEVDFLVNQEGSAIFFNGERVAQKSDQLFGAIEDLHKEYKGKLSQKPYKEAVVDRTKTRKTDPYEALPPESNERRGR